MANHHHTLHQHSVDFLDDLVEDAGSDTARIVRRRMGYPDDVTFFEEAPAGVLAHDAMMPLYLACTPHEREQRIEHGWSSYVSLRNAYLTAAVVFGRADLLAMLLLDAVGLGDRWQHYIDAGEVHRQSPVSVLHVVLDRASPELLNESLTVDLPGTYSLPVWVALLLATRPSADRYRDVLRRFQDAGATGFARHLRDKHPVLMNRRALNAAIDDAERAAFIAMTQGTIDRLSATRETLRQPSNLLALLKSLTDPLGPMSNADADGEPEPPAEDPPTTDGPVDATDLYMSEVEEREAANHAVTQASGPQWMEPGKSAWGWNTDLTDEQQAAERARLGLPPPIVFDPATFDRNQRLERQLVSAITVGNIDDVQRILDAGADPDTPNHCPGMALARSIGVNEQITALLLARGASPTRRFYGVTPLTMLCQKADQRSQGIADAEQLEDALNVLVQTMGLLVRAGATASQQNDLKNQATVSVIGNVPDAWQWIVKMPILHEAYLAALEERKDIEEEAAQGLESIRQAVADYPAQWARAGQDAQVMLDKAKRTVSGGVAPGHGRKSGQKR
ncbi:hypothetical protein [Paraburkholderia sp. C35]|uniref:hypothetical protein n=1 Tax=Paraburkholderia sp. C35 TaxID=2126993 RepID=UPI000D699AB8|nr:hypothetical protein [Paraburkholderia sp. C35]